MKRVQDVMESPPSISARPPLCVDLDGGLVATHTLWESVLALARQRPSAVLQVPFWLLGGRAALKRRVASEISLDPARLPYREDVVAFIRREQEAGRKIILTSSAHRSVAEAVAAHVGLFNDVVTPRNGEHLSGRRKLEAVEAAAGNGGFSYLGEAERDLPVWRAAREALLVNPRKGFERKVASGTPVVHVFRSDQNKLQALVRALRVEQWVKNALLFVPLLMAHEFGNVGAWVTLMYAFVAFSLCASATYIVNDLLDLDSDRLHPAKRFRPFAAGTLSIRAGVLLAPLLLAAAFATAFLFIPPIFGMVLALYFVLTFAYSLHLKQVIVLDVLVLAALYTMRILAGAVAIGIPASTWLLGFSMFIFISLAFVKRYAELRIMQDSERMVAEGRGYEVQDMELLRSIGPSSGYLAVVVLALYINSSAVVQLYEQPGVLWLMGPVLLYWITRVWFKAHRGLMDDDPIVFAMRDPVSYLLGGFVVLIFILASNLGS